MARLRVALNISATAPTGWIDGAFVLGMASVALLEITVAPGPYSVHDEMVVAVVTAVVLSGGLWWRRRQPLLLAVVAGLTLVVAFQLGLVPQAWLAVYIAILGYSTGAYGRGWQSHAGLVAAVLVGCSIAFFAVNTLATDYVIGALGVTAAWLAGRTLRRGRDQAAVDRRSAIAQERARIARELHDIIGHGLSVIAIQSDAAEQALQRDPQLAAAPLRAIRRTAQDALAEMRRLVTILRVDDPSTLLQPQPGLSQLDALADRVRATGMSVSLNYEGDTERLPAGLDLAAYRIVQEALTNTRRHAGPAASAWVNVRVQPTNVEIEVTDDGVGTHQPGQEGHGLCRDARRRQWVSAERRRP